MTRQVCTTIAPIGLCRPDGSEALAQPAAALPEGIRRRAFHGFLDFSHVFNVQSLGSNQTWPCNATAVTTLEVDRKHAGHHAPELG